MRDPQHWNANELGPMGRCLRCFTPLSDERSFCLECGHSGTVFSASESVAGQWCYKHYGAAATHYCSLCARPVCDACIESKSHSYITMVSVTRCQECVAQMQRIENQFFTKLHYSHSCAKHQSKEAVSNCVKCVLPLCVSCEYFHRKGLFFKRVGPYCLTCFRTTR